MQSRKIQIDSFFGPKSYIYIRYILNIFYFIIYIFLFKEFTFTEKLFYGVGIAFLLIIGFLYHFYLLKEKISNKINFFIFILDLTLIFIIYAGIMYQSPFLAAIIWKSSFLFIVPIFSLIGLAYYDFTRKFILFFNIYSVVCIIFLFYISIQSGVKFSLKREITVLPEGANIINPFVIMIFYTMICFMVYRMKTMFKNYHLLLEEQTKELRENLAKMKWIFHDSIKISEELKIQIHALKEFMEKFNQEMQEEASSIEEITATIEELSSTSQRANEFISKQYQEIESIQKINQYIDENIQKIQDSLNMLSTEIIKSEKESLEGQNAIKTLVELMNNIKSSFQKVQEITEIINDIADRTNLLSLNASIEAARAGDYGKGFAIVAQEINRLAENSLENAKNINKIIKDSGKFIEKGFESSNFTENQIQNQYQQIKKVVAFFEDLKITVSKQIEWNQKLLNSLNTIHSLSKEIEQISKEQNQSTNSINKTITQMEKGIMDLSNKSLQLTENISKLSNLSIELENLAKK